MVLHRLQGKEVKLLKEQMWRDVEDYLKRGKVEEAGILVGQIINEIDPKVIDDEGTLLDSYDIGEMFCTAVMGEM